MRTIKLLLAILVAFFSILFISCGGKADAKSEENKTEKIQPVKVTLLQEEEVAREIDYSANLVAFEEVYLAPATPGRIIKVYPEIGDRVKKGQMLVQMDPTQLNTSLLQLENLKKDKQRFDTLIQYGGVTKQQYDQINTQYEVTKANVELLSTNVNLASPFNGVITAKYFENGELFTGAPNTQVGKPAIVVVQQINPIKAIISVSEKYYPVVKKGMIVDVKSDIYADKEFKGKISLIHPTINAQTKTFNIEIEVANNEELLRPGMFASVNMEFAKETAMVVPVSAVLMQRGTNNRYVFVYKDGKAHRIDVKLGKRFDDKVEIISDEIGINDQLIIAGHNNLIEGDKVEIVKD